MPIQFQEQIELNIRVHDAIANSYETTHTEIFNPGEQRRLGAAVARALKHATAPSTPPCALDVGCGSGNLTHHLLADNCTVTGADVSPKFLELCRTRFGETGRFRGIQLSGDGLTELETESFDFVGAYSVLHHVPDYLGLIDEMIRVVKPGGIIYIDHESAERVYGPDRTYDEFTRRAGTHRGRLKRFLTKTRMRRRLLQGVRAVVQPQFKGEGDIHVWPDDHIDFGAVTRSLTEGGCEIVEIEEYLGYASGVDEAIHTSFASRCSDTVLLVARKVASRHRSGRGAP